MKSSESAAINRRVADLERITGKPIIIRGTRLRNPLFRGRIVERSGCIIVEYRDDVAGYFWHYEIIEELLSRLEEGRRNVVLYEGDIQYTDVQPRSPIPSENENQ